MSDDTGGCGGADSGGGGCDSSGGGCDSSGGGCDSSGDGYDGSGGGHNSSHHHDSCHNDYNHCDPSHNTQDCHITVQNFFNDDDGGISSNRPRWKDKDKGNIKRRQAEVHQQDCCCTLI